MRAENSKDEHMEAISFDAEAFTTHGDQTRLLEKRRLAACDDPGPMPKISVATSVRHQTMDGGVVRTRLEAQSPRGGFAGCAFFEEPMGIGP